MHVLSLDSLQGTSHTISNVNPNSSMQSFAYLEKSQHNGSVSNQGTYDVHMCARDILCLLVFFLHLTCYISCYYY